MNSSISRLCRHLLFKRSTSVRFDCPRFYSSDKTEKSSETKTEEDEAIKQRRHLLDVTEYYSQYIKEYEQGGFKDDESVQWATRREILRISRGRGQTGVMDVDEIVDFLRSERIADICALRMPDSFAYAPHMVIGTPLSRRHMNAMTEKLVKAYKKKRAHYDPESLRTEAIDNPEWRVFDLANVVVHLMTEKARKKYDIEMLWAVGPEHDDLANGAGDLDEYQDRLKKLQEDIESLSNASENTEAKRKHV